MEHIRKKHISKRKEWLPLKVALIYALLGSSWIYFSDTLMWIIAVDPRSAALISQVKGLCYILVTTALLFFLIRRGVLRIQRTEVEYRELVETANSIILRIDSQGRITFANRHALSFFAFSEAELVGKPLVGSLLPEIDTHGNKTIEALHDFLNFPERYSSCVGEYIRSNGEKVWIAGSSIATRDSENRVVEILCIGNDITEQKRMETALAESDRRFREMLENVHLISVRLDSEGNITFCNDYLLRLTGWKRDEVIGKNWFELFLPPDVREVIGPIFFNGVLAGAVPPNVENEIITRQGERRLIAWNNTVFRDERGRIIGSTSLGEDVTDRKRAEEALRRTTARFENTLESISDAFFSMDGNLTVTYFNAAAERTMNRKATEVIGKYLFDAFPEAGGSIFDEKYHHAVAEKVFVAFECYFDIDPYRNWYDVRVYPQEDGISVYFQVITDRKLAEAALRESEELYRTLVSLSPDAISVADPDGLLTFLSAKARQMFGHSPEDDILGRSILYWVAPEEQERASTNIKHLLTEGTLVDTEYTLIRKDGTRLNGEVNAAVIHSPHDSSMRMIFITRDITERKRIEEERRRLEERLQRAEKMEALGTLAGGVAHDLNNILGIVVGYSELLLYAPDGSSSTKSKATEILNAGQKAAAIVQDLLTLARRGIQHRDVLNLNKVLLESQRSPEFAKVLSYHPDIMVKTDLEMDLLNISGSPVHLEKSFINLVSNAVEAMPAGGALTIKTGNRYLDKPVSGYDTVREGDYVVLSLSDTGEGISAADLKRIFEPFYTKKIMGRSGTGLGLAVVWGTVKDHCGYINVESEEGKGTTVTLYFPVTREDITPEQVSLSAAEYMGNGESILVVDDVKQQRELAMEMLTKQNYRVTTVSSGEEALEYLKLHQVDLVVLDMIMEPGMDGLDTYSKILQIHPGQKAIIVSGFSETERVGKAQALGAGAYVKKPYVLEKLGLAVRKELNRTA